MPHVSRSSAFSSRIALGAALILAVGALESRGQEAGAIQGRVTWTGAEVPDLEMKVKKGDTSVRDAAVCAVEGVPDESIVVDKESKGVANCLVYLARISGSNPEAERELVESQPEVVMDQVNCRFVPHVMAMHADQTITFKSSDAIGHNVRLLGFANPAMNVMLPPKGSIERDLRPERRPLQVSCDIHEWMKAYVMVFDHPFFAVTDEQGNFEIDGVPAGEHAIIVWQERVGYVTDGRSRGTPVNVEAGATTEFNAEIAPDDLR